MLEIPINFYEEFFDGVSYLAHGFNRGKDMNPIIIIQRAYDAKQKTYRMEKESEIWRYRRRTDANESNG